MNPKTEVSDSSCNTSENMGRILVIDDVSSNQLIVSSILSKIGFDVLTVSSGQEAFEILQEDPPHIIICDIMMPVMDGYQVCEKVRANKDWKDIYFIFLTAKMETGDTVKGLEMGGDDYLTKPFEAQELIARVRVGMRIVEQKIELKQLAAKLASSEILASLASICASMSHEMNSPLGALSFNNRTLKKNLDSLHKSSFQDLLVDVLNDNEKALDHMEMISSSIKKLYLYGQGTQVVEVDIHNEVETAFLLLSHKTMINNLRIRKELSAEPLSVPFYEGGFVQVLVNLISNAMDASAGANEVTIKTKKQDHLAIIQVKDNGKGIPQNILDKIFDPLFTTKPKDTGIGLGLSICRDIVENNNGTIEVTSSPETGTVFTIKLPTNFH